MAKTSVRLRIITLAIIVVTAGLIVASIAAQRLSEPYIAKELCKQGEVISKFERGLKGGYYLYSCKDPSTGEAKNITPEVGSWSFRGLLVSDLLILLLSFGVTWLVLRIFRGENNLEDGSA